MQKDVIELWEFPGEAEHELMAHIAHDRAWEPDARAVLLSRRGDVIALQLVDGEAYGNSDSKFYVEGFGSFVLERREVWPALPGGKPRVLLTVRASPAR